MGSNPFELIRMDHATRSGASSASSTGVVDVLVPVALNQAYSYRVPRGMELKPGDVVCVPLGPREVVAVVWAENANPDPRLHNRLKDVGEKLDVPPLKGELRALVDWVANYTLSARGMVLRMTLRMGEHLGPERMRMGVRLIGEAAGRGTAGSGADAISAGAAGTRSVIRRAGFFASAAHRGGRDAGAGGEWQFSCRAARWRHRIGQDRSLFRSCCRGHPPRQAVADPDAGDRADRTVPRSLCAAFRRAAAGMAFRADPAHQATQLGRDRGG